MADSFRLQWQTLLGRDQEQSDIMYYVTAVILYIIGVIRHCRMPYLFLLQDLLHFSVRQFSKISEVSTPSIRFCFITCTLNLSGHILEGI